MTLNASEPTAVRMVSELPAYIRETRAGVNAVTAGTGLSVTDLALTGETSLSIGTELAAVGHEIIFATSTGASILATILNGTHGQIKTFIFGDTAIEITDDTADSGQFFLEQVALSNFAPEQHDVLCLVNVDGDGGATDHGYWKELYRMVSVR
jgi:hypothetical protein